MPIIPRNHHTKLYIMQKKKSESIPECDEWRVRPLVWATLGGFVAMFLALVVGNHEEEGLYIATEHIFGEPNTRCRRRVIPVFFLFYFRNYC